MALDPTLDLHDRALDGRQPVVDRLQFGNELLQLLERILVADDIALDRKFADLLRDVASVRRQLLNLGFLVAKKRLGLGLGDDIL